METIPGRIGSKIFHCGRSEASTRPPGRPHAREPLTTKLDSALKRDLEHTTTTSTTYNVVGKPSHGTRKTEHMRPCGLPAAQAAQASPPPPPLSLGLRHRLHEFLLYILLRQRRQHVLPRLPLPPREEVVAMVAGRGRVPRLFALGARSRSRRCGRRPRTRDGTRQCGDGLSAAADAGPSAAAAAPAEVWIPPVSLPGRRAGAKWVWPRPRPRAWASPSSPTARTVAAAVHTPAVRAVADRGPAREAALAAVR